MSEQISLFDLSAFKPQQVKIDKPIRLIELFAGIGSQAKALVNLGADFEHYKVIEFDKYAMTSYNAIHKTNFETSDIRNIRGGQLEIVDTDKYCYIMTYSFPCQDLSLAGKQRGMSKGSGTRSGLLWEVERILEECWELRNENPKYGLPQFLLMENVPQVIGEKNKPDFDEWCGFLTSLGYTNAYELLNAKDYGVPQNRNRCFMVSWLGKGFYSFPKPIELSRRLCDVLQPPEEVDETYYLSQELIDFYIRNTEKQKAAGNGFAFEPYQRERERESRQDYHRPKQKPNG